MKCNECGKDFDPEDLTQALYHEVHRPVLELGIRGYEMCQECKGMGLVQVATYDGGGFTGEAVEDCPICAGTGSVKAPQHVLR